MKQLFLILSLLFFSIFLFSQKDTLKEEYGEVGMKAGQQYIVTLHDDFEYTGEIIKDDGIELILNTKAIGVVHIPKFQIKTIEEVKKKKSIIYDDYQPEGPFTTRYSFTTNALPIKKGKNYGMLNIYGPEVHIAFTNNFNAGIMSSWIASPLVIAMKYSFYKEEKKINISFGTLIGTSGYINSFRGYGGLHWLNFTFGDRINNFTFSGGYAYLQTGEKRFYPPAGEYTNENYNAALKNVSGFMKIINGPIVSIAFTFKIGSRASFLFDSMIGYFNFEKINYSDRYDDSTGYRIITITDNRNAYTTALFLMPGVRFQKTERNAFQICVGGVSTFGDYEFSRPLPMISWFYKF